MTAMPQLVALFNGVGGGTVALIAWAEFIETKGFSHFKADQSPTVALVVGSLFAAVIGSVSFWGSLVAFAKLQENIIPKGVEKAFVKNAKLFQAANIVLLVAAVAAAVFIGLNKGCRSGGSCCSWCSRASWDCSSYSRSAAPTCPSSSRC